MRFQPLHQQFFHQVADILAGFRVEEGMLYPLARVLADGNRCLAIIFVALFSRSWPPALSLRRFRLRLRWRPLRALHRGRGGGWSLFLERSQDGTQPFQVMRFLAHAANSSPMA